MTSATKRVGTGGLAVLTVTLASLGMGACASSGGSGGSDGGFDVTVAIDGPHQTTSDASDGTTLTQRDVRSIFGNGETGPTPPTDAPVASDAPTSDAPPDDAAPPGDGSLDGPSHQDGAHPGEGGTSKDGGGDAGSKDSGTKDAAMKDSSTVCMPVTVPTGTSGLGACGAPVTGTCGPGSLTGFVATSPPPTGLHQGVCTTAQIQSIYDGCLGPNGSDMACTTAAAAMACYNCIFTDETAPKWGPIVTAAAAGSLAQPNLGGCLTLLEPCNSACAAAFEEDVLCEEKACGTNCPISTSASITAYDNCSNTIDNCAPNGCAAYSVGTGCAQSITGAAHPGALCFENMSNPEAQFLAIAPVFCGN